MHHDPDHRSQPGADVLRLAMRRKLARVDMVESLKSNE